MRTITLYLDYDARQNLHALPFEEIAPATEDVYLQLMPQAEGIFEARGMAAVRKTYISPRDIQRALRAATSVLPNAKDGVVGLLLPGLSMRYLARKGRRCRSIRRIAFRRGTICHWAFVGPA